MITTRSPFSSVALVTSLVRAVFCPHARHVARSITVRTRSVKARILPPIPPRADHSTTGDRTSFQRLPATTDWHCSPHASNITLHHEEADHLNDNSRAEKRMCTKWNNQKARV